MRFYTNHSLQLAYDLSNIYSQRVKSAERGRCIDQHGYDAGKEVKGEERDIRIRFMLRRLCNQNRAPSIAILVSLGKPDTSAVALCPQWRVTTTVVTRRPKKQPQHVAARLCLGGNSGPLLDASAACQQGLVLRSKEEPGSRLSTQRRSRFSSCSATEVSPPPFPKDPLQTIPRDQHEGRGKLGSEINPPGIAQADRKKSLAPLRRRSARCPPRSRR